MQPRPAPRRRRHPTSERDPALGISARHPRGGAARPVLDGPARPPRRGRLLVEDELEDDLRARAGAAAGRQTQNFVRDVLAVERVPRVDNVAGLRVHAAPEAEPDLRPTELGETKTVPADFCSAGMLAPFS